VQLYGTLGKDEVSGSNDMLLRILRVLIRCDGSSHIAGTAGHDLPMRAAYGEFIRNFLSCEDRGLELQWLPVVAGARLSENMEDSSRALLLKNCQ